MVRGQQTGNWAASKMPSGLRLRACLPVMLIVRTIHPIEQFESGREDRQQAMPRAGDEMNCCQKGRQRILDVLHKGDITQTDGEIDLAA